MVETVRDADYCILVTEPTPFGRYDLELSVEVLRYLKVPFGIIINKYRGISGIIEEYAAHEKIPILLKLEDDRRLAEAYSRGEPAVKHFPDLQVQLRDVYAKILKNFKETKTAYLKNTVY
jgi:MinD superfamily P-loop ATPase